MGTDNKELSRAYQAAYRRNHPERLKVARHRYYETHKEKFADTMKRNAEKNRAKYWKEARELRDARLSLGLSQWQAAYFLKISQGRLSAYETARSPVPAGIAQQLVDAVNGKERTT